MYDSTLQDISGTTKNKYFTKLVCGQPRVNTTWFKDRSQAILLSHPMLNLFSPIPIYIERKSNGAIFHFTNPMKTVFYGVNVTENSTNSVEFNISMNYILTTVRPGPL